MLVTFIIPSKGRPTLADTIMSLYEQGVMNLTDNKFEHDMEWNAIVCFDNVEPTISDSFRVRTLVTPEKLGVGVNGAGNVRNYAIKQLLESKYNDPLGTHPLRDFEMGIFIAFVDDDDTVAPSYTRDLGDWYTDECCDDLDCKLDFLVTNMKYADGKTLPRDNTNEWQGGILLNKDNISEYENRIGISFAVKDKVFIGDLVNPPIFFEPSSGEDFNFLRRMCNAGYTGLIDSWANYIVAPLGCAVDRRPKP